VDDFENDSDMFEYIDFLDKMDDKLIYILECDDHRSYEIDNLRDYNY
jgi:hypothetical protein